MKNDNSFRLILEKTLQHALSHLENLDSKSVAATSTLSEFV